MQKLTNLHADFVASHLRNIITRLQGVLRFVEKESVPEDAYIIENLKGIEVSIKQLRKLYERF